MNLILFEPDELDRPLSAEDPRAIHLLSVLRRAVGEPFDIGVINGPRGKGWIVAHDVRGLALGYRLEDGPPPDPPAAVSLLVGLSRPQTMRHILRDATTLGARELLFVPTSRSEAAYARSSLWTTGEWRRHLIDGAAQAFVTRLPGVRMFDAFADCIAALSTTAERLALDNYEAGAALADWTPQGAARPSSTQAEGGRAAVDAEASPHERATAPPAAVPTPSTPLIYLAIGAERGWTRDERTLLRASGFTLVHLGRRVLRTESACIAGLTLLLARLGCLQ